MTDTLQTSETFSDHLLGASIPSRDTRLRLVRLDRTLDEILAAHDYPPAIRNLLAEALVVADVEVAPHPRAVDLVEVLGQQVGRLVVVAFRVVQETVPDILDQNMNAQFCGQGQCPVNLLDRAIPNLLVILVLCIANSTRHQKHR